MLTLGWGRERPTPYGLFSTFLGLFILLGTLALTGTSSIFVQRYLLGEAAVTTQHAVEAHFADVFGTEIFSGTPLAPAGTDGTLESYTAMVRMHLNLYDIRDTWFTDRTGTVVFAYDRRDMGRPAPVPADDLNSALGGSAVAAHPSRDRLRVILPVEDDGQVVGAAIVDRDISAQMNEVGRMRLKLTLVSLAVGAVLFLGLERVYRNSTYYIRRQSRALREALDEVERTYDTTLEAIAGVLDLRDQATRGHSVRVMLYTDRLARELGIPDEERRHIVRGALLHDVGKMAVPDSVLQKPGPLTPEEWEIMRRHPRLGYEMLSHIPFLKPALPVVLHHHERWDGQGYPDALRGPQIPLGARIFAVVDALDAMTSERPYRVPMSLVEAIHEIVRNSGRQFDPWVVEAFVRIPAEDWAEIRSRSGDDRILAGWKPRAVARTS